MSSNHSKNVQESERQECGDCDSETKIKLEINELVATGGSPMSDVSSESLNLSGDELELESVGQDSLLEYDVGERTSFVHERKVSTSDSDRSQQERFGRLKPSTPKSEIHRKTQSLIWHPEISFDLLQVLEGARYFLVHSVNFKNVIRSQEHGFWATLQPTEDKLNAAYGNTRSVIVIPCIPSTSQFAGFARLASMSHPDKWKWDTLDGRKTAYGGVFKVDWLSRERVDFSLTTHLVPGLDSTKPVCSCADGQEIPSEIARELLRMLTLDENVSMRSIINKCQQASRRQHEIPSLDLRHKLGPRNRYYDVPRYDREHPQFMNPKPRYVQDPLLHYYGRRYSPSMMTQPSQPTPVCFTDGMFTYQYEKGIPKLKLSHTSKERQDYQMYLKKHSSQQMRKDVEFPHARDHDQRKRETCYSGKGQHYRDQSQHDWRAETRMSRDSYGRKSRGRYLSGEESRSRYARTYSDESPDEYKMRKHHRSRSSNRRHEYTSSHGQSRKAPREEYHQHVADDHKRKAGKNLARKHEQTRKSDSSSHKSYKNKISDVDSYSDISSSSSYKSYSRRKTRYRLTKKSQDSRQLKHLPKQYQHSVHEESPEYYSRGSKTSYRSVSKEGTQKYHRKHASTKYTPDRYSKSSKHSYRSKSRDYSPEDLDKNSKPSKYQRTPDNHATATSSQQMTTTGNSQVSQKVSKSNNQQALNVNPTFLTTNKELVSKSDPGNQTSYIHVCITETLPATMSNQSQVHNDAIPVIVTQRQ